MAPIQTAAKTASPIWEEVRTRYRPEWGRLEQFLGDRLSAAIDDSRPKYRILQDGLVEAIRTGVIPSDHRLPTEGELTAITPYSLGTVQRALKSLVDAGIILRKPGVGTIVAPWRWELEHPLHSIFPDEDGNLLPLYTRVFSRRRTSTQGPWSEFLGAGDQTVCIKRETNVGGKFVFYSEFYVDGGRYPIFLDTPKRELNGVNFKHLLAREFHLSVTDVSNRLGVAPVPTSAVPVLSIEPGTPCMRQRVFVMSNSNPLYYQEFWFPPQAEELFIESSLEGHPKI